MPRTVLKNKEHPKNKCRNRKISFECHSLGTEHQTTSCYV